MNAGHQSIKVRDKKSFSFANDFPYDHPLVGIGYEEEPDVNVYEFDHATVNFSINKAVFSNNRFWRKLSSGKGIEAIQKARNIKHIEGSVLDLVTPGANLYSHWLLDLLPKIDAVRSAGFAINNFDKIFVNYFNSCFKKESFMRLGIDPSKVIDFKSSPSILHVNKLVTCTPCRKSLFTPQWVEHYIKSLFGSPSSTQGERKKIYISRSKGNSRRILNEGKLLELLIPLGFEVLYCEDHSIEYTAKKMARAQTVVAPHGAGLANILFCPQDTSVVEFFSAHISPEYFKYCKSRGNKYSCIQMLQPNGEYLNLKQTDFKLNRSILHPMNMLMPNSLVSSDIFL